VGAVDFRTLAALVADAVGVRPVAFVLALLADFACLDVQHGEAQLLTQQLGLTDAMGAEGPSRSLLRLGRAYGGSGALSVVLGGGGT